MKCSSSLCYFYSLTITDTGESHTRLPSKIPSSSFLDYSPGENPPNESLGDVGRQRPPLRE